MAWWGQQDISRGKVNQDMGQSQSRYGVTSPQLIKNSKLISIDSNPKFITTILKQLQLFQGNHIKVIFTKPITQQLIRIVSRMSCHSQQQISTVFTIRHTKQAAWWPNKLCCKIELIKLSKYYFRSRGKKRAIVECHHMEAFAKLHSSTLANNSIGLCSIHCYKKFCPNISHQVTNYGKNWRADVVSQTLIWPLYKVYRRRDNQSSIPQFISDPR